MEITIKTRIKLSDFTPILDEMAVEMNTAKRGIFQEMTSKEKSLAEIKKESQMRYQITARQFNSIRFDLQGVIRSAQEVAKLQIEKIKRKITKKSTQLKEISSPFKKHHLKRKVEALRVQLKNQRDRVNSPSICFGSRELFQRQFHLKENGYQDHQEWKRDWEMARNSQFFLVGSKDESFGNQSCQLLPGRLQLRLTNQLAKKHGQTTIQIPVEWTYRIEVISNALLTRQAISYRFVKESGSWYVHLTTDLIEVKSITNRANGALGIDLNPFCLAVTQISSDGNLLKSWHVDTLFRGRRAEQTTATLGEEIAKLVQYACEQQIPIVIEKLDFNRKKEELRSRNLNRMLSNFAYEKFYNLISTQCFRAGVELISVNPAFTSIIGKYKFSEGYGLSTHAAAAMAIARRGLSFGEALRVKAQARPWLPDRNRSRHVWHDWRGLTLKAKREKQSSLRRRRPERTRGDRKSSSATSYIGPPL